MASNGASKWTFDSVAFEEMMKFLRNHKVEITEIYVSLDTEVDRLIFQINNKYPLDSEIPESAENVDVTFRFNDDDYDSFEYVVKIDFYVYFGITDDDFLVLEKCDFSTSIKPMINEIQKVVPVTAEIIPFIHVEGHVRISLSDECDEASARADATFTIDHGEIVYSEGVSSFDIGQTSFDVDGNRE